MTEGLKLDAELRARQAEKLPAFDGINLLGIKRQLEELLALIGRGGIFDEYTKHDISHVDAAIESLDWIVPETTKQIMTPADWLLSVLAIYFHDLGMLVTKNEYAGRDASSFPEYRDRQLFGGQDGADYKARVEQLQPQDRERFLYQEYVREHHATRIRDWVMGRAPDHLGVTHDTMTLVAKLLDPLGSRFRQDLALVCESHHLDDLQDFRKYKVSQPYGKTDQEAANVHYAALLLRAADLLHITKDRTPSITFKAIDPIDPISQNEWAKQMGVVRVRPKIGTDREGNLDEDAPRDTVEVHALYREENGFFGLTAYLDYAGKQLLKCHEAARIAQRTQASRHGFPWKQIDDSRVETEGFVRETFEFTIDQARVLDLLTGHTLYNDTSVVLRELVQNALDAIRFQHYTDLQTDNSAKLGTVRIHWNSRDRVLSVEDDGTGMTQDIIERHLLKVGASRYQDDDFKRQHPDFAAISRFGIGILSTFMFADEVEIVTSHPDDEEARRLSLRSVHGRYLVRLLDKSTDEIARRLSPHGTLVKVKVRASAELTDIAGAARRWVVIPGCEVLAQIDEDEPVRIGFERLRDALQSELEAYGLSLEAEGRRIRIDQREVNGVALAYAVRWSEYFHDWSFMWAPYRGVEGVGYVGRPALGTCVEGIRVDSGGPGLTGAQIWAIANASGPNAPRTNVARSGIDAKETPELLRSLYSMYCQHVADEMANLQKERGFSLTWAATEAAYLLQGFLGGEGPGRATHERLFAEAVQELPLFIVETGRERRASGPASLAGLPHFWTTHSWSTRSAEVLIRESASGLSLTGLLEALGTSLDDLPPEPLVCGAGSSTLFAYALSGREVGRIDVHRERCRVDLQWVPVSNPARWESLVVGKPYLDMDDYSLREMLRNKKQLVPMWAVEVRGLADEIGVMAMDTLFYVPGTPLSEYLRRLVTESVQDREGQSWVLFVWALLGDILVAGQRLPETLSDLRRVTSRYGRVGGGLEFGDAQELLDVLAEGSLKVFDESAWSKAKH
jgi:hypothetical protein